MKKFLSYVLACTIIVCNIPVFAQHEFKVYEINDVETIINAQDYCSAKGDISATNDYWLDIGKGYIANNSDNAWSTSYQVSVSKEYEGIYDILTVCNHWSSNLIELKISLNGIVVSTVGCSNITNLGETIPEIEVGKVRLSEGTHTVKVEGISCSRGYHFREIKIKQANISLVDNLVIPATNYFSCEGELVSEDYYIDKGNIYLKNEKNEYWSATYKISVSDENKGLYKLSTVCNHWSSSVIELKVSLDGSAISTVQCSNITTEGEQIPSLMVEKIILNPGVHTIKVEGISCSVGYYLKQLVLNKIDCGIGNPTLGISANISSFSDKTASVDIIKHTGNVNTAVLVAALTNGRVLKSVSVSEPVSLIEGESVQLTVYGLETELESGDVYSLYCWESFESLKPITYKNIYKLCANDDKYFEESPPESRAENDKLNDAYRFITEDGFKGVYCTEEQYTETETIDALKYSGINTFIVYIYHRDSMTETEFKNIISKWKTAVGDAKLITVVAFGSDQTYANTQFGEFVDKTGLTINAPCPLSKMYWNKVYGDRAKWSYDMGVNGCMIDLEMYGADTTHFTADRKCYCDDCWRSFCNSAFSCDGFDIKSAKDRNEFLNQHNLTTSYANYQSNKLIEILSDIRSSLPENFMLGYLIYFQELQGLEKGLGTSTAPALVFDEYTYFMHDNNNSYVYNILGSIHGNNNPNTAKPAIFLPGFWPQKYAASEQDDIINSIMSENHRGKYPDGYWIWCLSSFMFTEDDSKIFGCMSGQKPADYIETLKNVTVITNK